LVGQTNKHFSVRQELDRDPADTYTIALSNFVKLAMGISDTFMSAPKPIKLMQGLMAACAIRSQ
jgi:hypothetical protein